MFDSGIPLRDIVEELKQEVDVALDIPNSSYVQWANALEQLLYTEIIREQNRLMIEHPGDAIDLDTFPVPASEAKIRFEDIHAVYADGVQFIKSTVASGPLFHNTYFKVHGASNNVGFCVTGEPARVDIVYFVKPIPKEVETDGSIGDGNVMLPLEFVDLMKSKLRGEAYKIANEDDYGAKWINDYNILLETFKAWVSSKQPSFGL